MNSQRLRSSGQVPLLFVAFLVGCQTKTPRASAAETPSQVNQVQTIAPDVYFHEGDIKGHGHCNNGWVIFEDYVLVIDGNFPSGAHEIIPKMVETLRVRRAKAMELLNTIPNTWYITPESAYFFFWNIEYYLGSRTEDDRLIRTDVDLVDYLLRDANVAVVAGSLCGTPGYFRVTYAIKEDDFKEGITHIRTSLEKLRK